MSNNEYTLTIKCNSTTPQRQTVMDLIDRGQATFKTEISDSPIRGFYVLYIDEPNNSNAYGFLQGVSIDGQDLTNEQVEEFVKNIKTGVEKFALVSHTDKIMTAKVKLSAKKSADLTNSVSNELQDLIDEAIKAGYVTKEEMDARLDVMNKNKVDEALKIRVVRGYRKYNKNPHQPRTIFVDPFLDQVKVGEDGIIAEGLRCATMRMPTICEGEKSVGKNVYMETIAWLLGMPLYMIGFSRNMNPNAIYGEKSTDNSASQELLGMKDNAIAKVMLDGNIPFKDEAKRNEAIKAAGAFELAKARAASVSIITDASELFDWMVDGGVMVFNEMNMAESNFFSSFANPITDGTGFLFFPGRGEVKMNSDSVLFGTQNADYEGVQNQNEATMSRFNTLSFKQPKKVIELLKAATYSELKRDGYDKTTLKAAYFDQAQRFYGLCMDSVHNGTISNSVLNIRGFVRALKTVAESGGRCTLKRWLEICVVNGCPADEQEAIKGILRNAITC